MIPGQRHAWMRYELYTATDGTILGHASTNDNLDRGYPSQDADWHVEYRANPRASAWEVMKKHTGLSHVGISGIVVEVYLDGQKLERDAVRGGADGA